MTLGRIPHPASSNRSPTDSPDHDHKGSDPHRCDRPRALHRVPALDASGDWRRTKATELADARALVKDKTDKDITVRHLISVEGVMRALARRLGEDEDRWALAGLFHDLDQDQTGEDPERHAFLTAEWLRQAGVEEPVVKAVLAHEQYRTDLMSRAVVHADAIAGLLVAAALVRPERSAGMKVSSVKRS
jgi:uncharacterized protein